MPHLIKKRAYGTAAEIAAAVIEARELVVNTDDYSLVLGDGTTMGGRARFASTGTAATAYSTPASGATVTAAAGERYRVIDPAGTIAALTLTLPPSPQDGDTYEATFRDAVTLLTATAPGGATVLGSGSLQPANTGASWRYRAADTTWDRQW